jgi:hypothetical protein
MRTTQAISSATSRQRSESRSPRSCGAAISQSATSTARCGCSSSPTPSAVTVKAPASSVTSPVHAGRRCAPRSHLAPAARPLLRYPHHRNRRAQQGSPVMTDSSPVQLQQRDDGLFAYHEAGHAVAVWVLGRRSHRIRREDPELRAPHRRSGTRRPLLHQRARDPSRRATDRLLPHQRLAGPTGLEPATSGGTGRWTTRAAGTADGCSPRR